MTSHLPQDAVAILRGLLAGAHAQFAVLSLDTENRIVAVHVVPIDTQDSEPIVLPQPGDPQVMMMVTREPVREVFKAATMGNAAAIIVGHFRSSGDPKPSKKDAEFCGRLEAAGLQLGIRIVDYLVLTSDGYYSFREKGAM